HAVSKNSLQRALSPDRCVIALWPRADWKIILSNQQLKASMRGTGKLFFLNIRLYTPVPLPKMSMVSTASPFQIYEKAKTRSVYITYIYVILGCRRQTKNLFKTRLIPQTQNTTLRERE